MIYTIVATAAFGLESVVARELKGLGYENLVVENGRVSLSGDERDIARCNIWLRTADRVLVEISRFKATDFEELYQGAHRVCWEQIIPPDGKMHVTGKSIKSKLFSVSSCQSVVKKAVVEAMKRKYHVAEFAESGPVYKIEVSLLKDMASLTIDTTGPGLHKRGYRQDKGEAPLRETLAAGLVLLSGWEYSRTLADPFCGSGTIPIEAALIARNKAPGLERSFVSETWPQIPKYIWGEVREDARKQMNDAPMRILASDQDESVLRKARHNAERAGVADLIVFQKLPVDQFRSRKKYGCIICNPPYGERLSQEDEIKRLCKTMGQTFLELDTWSFFILTAFSGFEPLFGRKATKNRKLYNGMIQCYFYEYFGPRPPGRSLSRS
ncbi:MAG TPA: class I SAM-dependent RNA methyltransferase [Syntrophorhabdaceae bacterium]|nr:class I SAM-dependent RNA methyltransferase [Syntrophorhabdaceae bacterium]